MSQSLKAAIVQQYSVPLAIGEGMARVTRATKDAIELGAKVIAFGEHFVGGAPAWLRHHAPATLWEHPGTRDLHALLLAQALRGDDPRFQPLQWAVDIAGVIVSFGGYERVRGSLYSTQFLLRPKAPVLRHRKLMLAPGEPLLLGTGDGSTLGVHTAPWGSIGQLAAAEHWMPLARAAMHHAGETVHVAAWPALDDIALLASTHYAYEGRCFVLAAGTLLTRHDLVHGYARAGGGDGPGLALLAALPEGALQQGNSAIIAPDGVTLAQAGDRPVILTADLDLGDVDRGLGTMDMAGAQSRPDMFELRVDRRPRTGIVDIEDSAGESAAA
ncbi:nitrilase-related carbon-nitrogen hydrolase [Sphingomonas hengshuiensis]|uniref:nitrilase-related carbon-nitrogen hydrolase n=1 Tax=Sphingomonas hengshuiensis TaxID=1609977 RepID=UPI0005CA1FE5|nr:nitrilase-related carbon-nitrogen hydrolase [Sphingomonas hengshuiensis]